MLADEVRLKVRDEFVHGYVNEEGTRVFPTLEALAKRKWYLKPKGLTIAVFR